MSNPIINRATIKRSGVLVTIYCEDNQHADEVHNWLDGGCVADDSSPVNPNACDNPNGPCACGAWHEEQPAFKAAAMDSEVPPVADPQATAVSYGKPPVEPPAIVPFHEAPCCDVVPCDNNYVTDERGFVREPDGVVTCADHRSKPDSDGWIEWKGGDCPVHADTIVETEWTHNENITKRAGQIRWHYWERYPNMTRYRLVTPAPKQFRPFASAETYEILQMINDEMQAIEDNYDRDEQPAGYSPEHTAFMCALMRLRNKILDKCLGQPCGVEVSE